MHSRQSFHFQKIPQGLNINIFCENLHEASFYIKQQVQFFFSFKNLFLPLKSAFLVFEENPPQKFRLFSSCFCSELALKTIDIQMSLILM